MACRAKFDGRLQVDRLQAWLTEFAPSDQLMPVEDGSKIPMFKHASPAEWTLAKLCRWRATRPSHTNFAIILKAMCVVDVDNAAVASELESRFPELARAPCEKTAKGMHYFFTRPALADTHGFYDARAPVLAAVDFKTRTSSGTGGVIVVSPSTGKSWIRAPWSTTGPAPEMSETLLRSVAKARHPPRRIVFTFADHPSRRVERVGCHHLASSPYVSMFTCGDLNDALESDTVPVKGFTPEAVAAACDAVENAMVDLSLDEATITEAFRFCDFAGFPATLVAHARDATRESRGVHRVHPQMQRALTAAGLVTLDAEMAKSVACANAATSPCFGGNALHLAVGPPPPAPSDNRALVCDPAAYFERDVPGCVLRWLRAHPGKLFAAGGRVCGAVATCVPRGSDVDLFVVSDGVPEGERIVDMARSDPSVRSWSFTGYALTMVCTDDRVDDRVDNRVKDHVKDRVDSNLTVVQIILVLNTDLESTLRRFDFAPSRVAAHATASGKLEVVATPCFVESVRSMAFPLLQKDWSQSSVVRLTKYAALKNFTCYIPDLDRDRVLRCLEDLECSKSLQTCLPGRLAQRGPTRHLKRFMDTDRGIDALFVAEWHIQAMAQKRAMPNELRETAFADLMRLTKRLREAEYLDRIKARGTLAIAMHWVQRFLQKPRAQRACKEECSWRTPAARVLPDPGDKNSFAAWRVGCAAAM